MEAGLSRQQAKSRRAREAICEATIASLVEVGYAETSLNRVAAASQFSKGALQHHFPTKEDLIAATLDRLLARPFQPASPDKAPRSVDDALMTAWVRFINTPPYRALLEILNAARTDEKLQARISNDLVKWGRAMDDQSLKMYAAKSGDDDEVVTLLNMTRSFMRGLLIQEQYGSDQERNLGYVKKWIEMISPWLVLRERD